MRALITTILSIPLTFSYAQVSGKFGGGDVDGYSNASVTIDAECLGGCVTSIDGDKSQVINCFPNPTTESIELDEAVEWEVYSSNSVLVNSGEGKQIDLKECVPGVYIIRTKFGINTVVKQ